jgi:hypothetical protein
LNVTDKVDLATEADSGDRGEAGLDEAVGDEGAAGGRRAEEADLLVVPVRHRMAVAVVGRRTWRALPPQRAFRS